MATAATTRTPRHQRHEYSRPGPETPPRTDKKRPDGLWQGGHWWCNCEPRKKAALREAKKDTPNKGRFFLACKTYPFCDFFLWRDDALLCETALPPATDAASAEELPPPRPKTPTFTQRPLTSFGVLVHPARRRSEGDGNTAGRGIGSPESGDDKDEQPSPVSRSGQTKTTGATSTATATAEASMGTPCPPPCKRKRDVFEDDEFSDMGSDDERQLADIADKSVERFTRHTDAFATPAADRTIDAATGFPTPSVARTLFSGTGPKRQKTVTFEEPHPPDLPTPEKTPAAKGRTTDHHETPSSSPPDAAHDVAHDVMALLSGQKLEGPVLRAVQELLATSDRKTRGLAMGRESTRAALKLKDDKIARLQERVVALENKEKFHNSQLTNIKAQLMKMYEDN
ncbi:hypothetical protein TOPH_00360 [Tolypocladium ophioglossoides CBS 100239]|uniref:GRF-type domain-containing protein n=1 Tax=Tolypocladium ophioglossoides (strain CBS 100239) TaxID=1163406 RepID=A0A0L0NL45_TOLOC|nr:hypothetical protein TOPH_00360 [Tolypocladium ophioglossoides CBS 100239]